MRPILLTLLFGGLVASAVAASCSDVGPAVRKVTYSPELRYYEKAPVSSAMRRLAKATVTLDEMLRNPDGEPPRERVIEQLKVMETTVAELAGNADRRMHPLIDKNIEAFHRDLVAARTAVEKDPPNYFLAGSVAGACGYCHTGNGVK